MSTYRETSAEAYKYLRPFIPYSHSVIMDIMINDYGRESDGWTMREIRQRIIEEGIMQPDMCLSSSMSARLNEMVKEGYIEVDGKRECEISGRVCIIRRLKLDAYRDKQREEAEEETMVEQKRALAELFFR